MGMVALAWIPWSPLMGDRIDGPAVSRIDGILMLIAFAVFTWLWIRIARSERRDPIVAEVEQDVEAAAKRRPMPLWAAAGLFFVSLGILVGGGKFTELGAVGIAEALGMSQAMIGLTVVAIATSLPEVITSAIAAKKGHGDLAVGNVVGSNLFNILLVLGATTIVAPVPVPAGRGVWDLVIMLGLTALLWPLAVTHNRRLVRIEGAVLLGVYIAYIGFSVFWELRLAEQTG
jgi:cation:H+ antiporter